MATAGRKPGCKKTGGRQKGGLNKVTLSVKEAVLETFLNLGGVKHMTGWARENPSDFYRIAAKLIPQQIQADVTHKQDIDELSRDELINIAAAGRPGATGKGRRPAKPDPVH